MFQYTLATRKFLPDVIRFMELALGCVIVITKGYRGCQMAYGIVYCNICSERIKFKNIDIIRKK